MANLFFLSIRTPEKDFLESDVEQVIFTAPQGRLGVMAGHMPMITSVLEGTAEILIDGEWKVAAVGQGFAEISYDRVEFYLDIAEWADEIDEVRAKEALERAEHRFHSNLSYAEHIRSQAAMSRALNRLKAIESNVSHHRKGHR